jgi:hypothetical protein
MPLTAAPTPTTEPLDGENDDECDDGDGDLDDDECDHLDDEDEGDEEDNG